MKPPCARFNWIIGGLSAVLAAAAVAADAPQPGAVDPSKLPPAASRPVDYEHDIQPILESRCFRCHGPERPKSGFRLDQRVAALKGGSHGVDILPGQSAQSPLIHFTARLVEDMEMPPTGKGEPLTAEQIGLLRAWIDQGAKWPEGAGAPKTMFSFEPSFGWITVSGDRQQFREHWGLKEGWSGGLQDFRLEERTESGLKLEADGRVLLNQDDYRVRLNLEKPELGFVRMGVEQFRRYYDDSGGYYEPYQADPISLGKDLHMDVARAWFDVGLTLPQWPRMVLGYEYQDRNGSKSSLAWGDVASPVGGLSSVAIYPGFEDLEEKTHLLKFDVSHELYGVALEDNLRIEWYDLDSRRIESLPTTLGTPPPAGLRNHEEYDHFQAVNAFRLEKPLKDWLLLGGGYLYSQLDGNGSFTQELLDPLTPGLAGPIGDRSSPIVIERESHVFNLSSLWGPWEGLSLTAGLQNEWTHEEGFGQGLVRVLDPTQPPIQHLYDSERDKAILMEDVGVRYSRIPFTVLFADSRFRQEWVDHYEQDANSLESLDFLRDTDATIDLKQVRTGFNISPWRRVSLEASYRWSAERTSYDHDLDTSVGPGLPIPGFNPPNGYPAFLRRRDIDSDQVEARLVVHPASWVKTTFKYQLVATDYTTKTDSGIILGTGAPVPGGSLLAGNYDAHIFSLGAVLTPWRRLNLSTTFSYTDTRTISGVNGQPGVAPYQGDIYTVLSTLNFVLSRQSDCHLSYAFSRADYRQDSSDSILPLGIRYDRHGLMAGVSRRFSKKVTASLNYGFFSYDEPTSGGANDYIAHAIFASCKVAFD